MSQLNDKVGPQTKENSPKNNRLVLSLSATATLIAGLQGATQYFAEVFNYQEVLGGNINHIYAPWEIIEWASLYSNSYQTQIIQSGSVGLVIVSMGLLGITTYKTLVNNSSKSNKYLHGSARWAKKSDIVKMGLLPKKRNLIELLLNKKIAKQNGVVVGGWVDPKGVFHYLRHSGPEHILNYAPTRSGKGVGLVLPTLLTWTESTVITDLKGELWEMTAGWRKNHANNHVLRFEPSSSKSICWNPLDEIRIRTENEVGDAQNLANLIVDPDGKGLITHWQKTSFALLTGMILHAIYKSEKEGTEASLFYIDHMLADPKRDVSELWMEMVTYEHTEQGNHPAVGSAGRDMMDKPDDEGGSVLSTAKSYLSLYRDPIVAKNTSKSEFRIKDLMNNDKPVSLYIITKPNDKSRLRPLIRVLVNMIIRLNADEMVFENGQPIKNYKYKLLAMLDEFPSLGKLEILQESLAFVAGYGIKCYLICQDTNQLKSRESGYGADETVTSNCHVQNAYPPNRIETADHLSKLTGQTTVVKDQITTSGKRLSTLLGQVSRTTQEIQRPLLTSDECLRMPGPEKSQDGKIKVAGDMVVYVAGFPAIYGKQPLYFKDPALLARSQVPSPEKTDTLRNKYNSDVKL